MEIISSLPPEMPSSRFPSLLKATILELSDALERNLFSSAELVRTYLARIAEVNDYYHAIIELNPEASNIANALDYEQKTRGRRGYVLPHSHVGSPEARADNKRIVSFMEYPSFSKTTCAP